MAMQYINHIRAKTRFARSSRAQEPVLTDEDEAFLQRVVSGPTEGDSKANSGLVERDEQMAQIGAAQDIPLSVSPAEDVAAGEKGKGKGEERARGRSPGVAEKENRGGAVRVKKARPWSWFIRKKPVDRKMDPEATAARVSDVTEGSSILDAGVVSDHEAEREAQDMTEVLERLNLAAANNRVFSFSDETRQLLRKFNLVLKDLINGAPAAYRDLESLLTNGHKQLQQAYDDLPGFLKKLIEQLPDKMAETLGPELLAAAGVKAEGSGVNMENVGKEATAARKMGFKTPSLRELVGKPAAIVGMLRSIIAFLRARFPAVMGMNVLWSLALFILLFVLWYCHKRGREVRLEKERLVTEDEIAQMNAESTERIRATETLTTTAPPGAAIEEVHEGVQEAREARQAAVAAAEEGKKEDDLPSLSSPPAQANTSSRRKTPRKKADRIEPYPGT